MAECFSHNTRSVYKSVMLARFRRLVGDERGQDLAEYAIALAVVGLVAISASVNIGDRVDRIWKHGRNNIKDAVEAITGD